jgi:hypothetical protein
VKLPLAVVAGLIAAMKLARVESGELQNRSPGVRSAIGDSIYDRKDGDCGDENEAMTRKACGGKMRNEIAYVVGLIDATSDELILTVIPLFSEGA